MLATKSLSGGLIHVLVVALALAFVAGAKAETPPRRRCFGKVVTIQGTNEDDNIQGTPGDDVISGGRGNDIVYGRGGKDRICSGAGDDGVYGGPGPDRISSGGGRANTGGNVILGGSGDDLLIGGPAEDQLDGGNGDDIARGKGASDLLYGRAGRNKLYGGKDRGAFGDLVEYRETDASIVVNLTRARGRGPGRDVLNGIEDVAARSSGSATIIGNGEANFLIGSGADDRMEGKGGDDCFLPHSGSNDVDGGPGFDSYTANVSNYCGTDAFAGGNSPLGSGVVVDLAKGEAAYAGETSSLSSIEGAYGTSQEDQLYGNDSANLLEGAGSRDDVAGRAGDDRLDGGGGMMDTVDGGDGTDECRGAEIALNCE